MQYFTGVCGVCTSYKSKLLALTASVVTAINLINSTYSLVIVSTLDGFYIFSPPPQQNKIQEGRM